MFWVLVSIALCVFISWLFWVENEKIFIGIGIGFIAGFIIFILGAMSTGNYQEEAKYISETELIHLNNDEENPIYVMKKDKRKYVYMSIGSKNNEEKEIRESDNTYLDIVQSYNCEKPVLKKYSRKTKWGLFSIGGLSRIEYVFYIPTGTYQGLYDLK